MRGIVVVVEAVVVGLRGVWVMGDEVDGVGMRREF